MSDQPTIFGHPVTLALAMPDGDILVASRAIKVTADSIEIDPARISRLIGLAAAGSGDSVRPCQRPSGETRGTAPGETA